MKTKNRTSGIFTIILFILILFILMIFLLTYIYKLLNKTKNENNNSIKKKSIEIVISRYNENLEWTTKKPFNKYQYIVYNKGDDEEYEKTNVSQSYKIKNQGKCDHTYMYHLYHHYEKLSDIVIFLPGCVGDVYFKYSKAKILIELIEKYNEAFFIVDYKSHTNILDEYYYFKVDDYKSMTATNLEKNENINFRLSKVRPYGKWYEQNFDYPITNVTLFGIFSVNKRDIYNHQKEEYYKHMKSLEGAINDELSHYFEKSWEAVFYPLQFTNLLNYTNSITYAVSKIGIYYTKWYKERAYLDLSGSPLGGPILWNLIYFINNKTYLNYKIKFNNI